VERRVRRDEHRIHRGQRGSQQARPRTGESFGHESYEDDGDRPDERRCDLLGFIGPPPEKRHAGQEDGIEGWLVGSRHRVRAERVHEPAAVGKTVAQRVELVRVSET